MSHSLEVKRDTWCRHRTPFTDEHKTCKVGVDFHPFARPHNQCPCLGENPEAIARCSQYSAWTEEEIAAREAEFEAGSQRIRTIREAIIQNIKDTGENAGRIPCPACKSGTVGYSRAGNGHVWAKCSTVGCASWME